MQKRDFCKIWESYYGKVNYYLSRVLHIDPHTAEDLTQETFARVFDKLDTYDPRWAMSTWIYRIARNCAISHFRREHPDELLNEEETSVSTLAPVHEAAVSHAVGEKIELFLSGKDETARSIVYFRFYENMKLSQIAEMLSLPVGTVKSRLSSLKNELKKHLEGFQ